VTADLQLFNFEHKPIRVVVVDGEPQFVARDICNAIDLQNMSMALTRLDDDEKGVNQIDTPGGVQQVATITESGLYSLVLRSDKKEAAKFRRWVTHKVLPEIRRTGSYSHLPASPQQLPSKKELAQWVVEAEERAERAESLARELAVPASAWNELAESAGDYAVSDAAKVLSRDPHIEIKERALFQYMCGLEWVYKREGRWKAYRAQLDTGRLAEKVGRPYYHAGRDEMVAGEPTVRVTPKGLAELHKRLGGSEQLALMEAVS
jgi:prophage antirepressor-like protein